MSEQTERAAMIARSIAFLALFQVKRRYVGSLLGLFWSLLNPITMIGIYFLVFSVFLRVPITNFFVYLSSGVLPWIFINTSLQVSTNSFSARYEVLSSSLLPNFSFILADTLAEGLNFLIALAILVLLLVVIDFPPSPAMLALPLVLLPLFIFTFGACLLIAHLAVRFADVAHILQIVLSISFWLIPIVYHWSMVPRGFQPIIKYNLFSIMITPIQVILHGQQMPTWRLLLVGWLVALTTAIFAIWLHRRLTRQVIFHL